MSDDHKLLIETIEALGVDSATELDVTLSATGLTTGPTSTLAADLPFIEAEHRTTASDHVELQMGDQLGSGAMGVVTSAWQRSLRRWVAVKQPRSAQQASSVIQEARLAGGLDHPHIVPVHTLARIDEQPAMVMKQVEGATWRTLLRQPEHALWADWPGDQLTRHLEILTQVCRALEFAHDRGVLHLDVKLENVMVGRFGEVWLMDWGIAVHVEDLHRLPQHEIAGTLAYFAPEQLYGRRSCSERTDVFLLGAALQEVLTGAQRYLAASLSEAVGVIAECAPAEFPDSAPSLLVGVSKRACARRPEDRFSSARAFREALREAIGHLDAARLFRVARAKQEKMQALMAKKDASRHEEIAGLAATTRFSLEQAEERWPGTAHGASALRVLNLAQARWEMERGNFGAARGLLAQVDDPDPDFVSELGRLERQNSDELKALNEFKRERTFTSGGDYRRAIAVALNGLFWLATMWTWGYLAHDDPWWVAPDTQATFSLILVLFNLVVVQVQLPLFMDTHIRRGFLSTYLMFMVSLTLNRVLAIVDQSTYLAVFLRDGLIMALFMAALAAFVHPKAWAAAGIALVGVFVGAALPGYAFEVAGATLCAVNLHIASLLLPEADLEL